MPLPTRTVTGTYPGQAGKSIRFTLTDTVSDETDGDTALAGTVVTATIDSQGDFSIALFCQGATLNGPPIYTARPLFGLAPKYTISVPAGSGSIDLSQLITLPPTPTPPTAFAQLVDLTAETTRATAAEAAEATARAAADALAVPLTQKGAAGGVATLDGAGTVPDAQIPATITRDSELSAAVTAAVNGLLNGAPGALDTLKELADAIGDDANYAASITAALALKAPLASPALTGTPTAPTQSAGNNSTRVATTAYADAAVSTQHTADNGTYIPLPSTALLANLPTPHYISHRGSVNVYPENTLEAFRAAVAAGCKIINVDFWPLTDGGLGVMHDQTLDRTTAQSGNITDLDSSAVQQLVVDTATWFAVGSGWGNLKCPLGEQVLREFGNRVPLELEAKPAVAGSGAALTRALQKYGVSPLTCRIGSFALAEIAAPAAAGYPVMYLTTAANHAATDPATLTAAGVTWVALDGTSADMATQAAKTAEVARWHAAGIKVEIYTVLRRVDVWPWLIAGADTFAADDPLWVDQDTWSALTKDPFASGNFYSGMLPPSGSQSLNRGTFVGPLGFARWQQNQGGTLYNVMGPISPIKGAIDSTLQAATLVGATSIKVGPQNKPIAGKLLTIDPPPGSVTTATAGSGGTFAAGTYFYVVTAVGPSGETGPSREVSATVASNGTATVSGSVPVAATGINVYRGTSTGAQNTLVGSATITGKSFSLTDTGAAGTAQAVPAGVTETTTPASDGTRNSDGTYTVTVPALAKAHAAGVRVYGGTWTLSATVTFDAIGSDATRHADLIVGSPDDTKFNTGVSATDNGFQAFIRASGALVTTTIAGGAAVGASGAASSTAVSAPVTLSAGLTSGVAITSLPVTALVTAVVSGQKFVLPTGQVATASGSAAISATAIPVTSITPNATVASGSTLPQQVPLTVQRTQTQIVFTRTDTGTTITINTTDMFGGYAHAGINTAATGLLASFTFPSVTTP